MKVVAFLVSFVIFIGSLLLFGAAFSVPQGWNTVLFTLGLVGITVSLMIPFHLLERFD